MDNRKRNIESNSEVKSKKRRIHNVSDIDDVQFVDELEELPYLYRSVQAINWIKKNPFMFTNRDTIYTDFKVYIENIMIKFFSGIGFGYDPENYFELEERNTTRFVEKLIEIHYLSELSDNILMVNFATFIEFLTFNLRENLIKNGVTDNNVIIKIEEGMHFMLSTGRQNTFYDEYFKKPELPTETVFF